MKYVTQMGDTWDSIAYNRLGSCRYTQDLINANREYIDIFIFSAGTELELPEIEKKSTVKVPAWKK